MSAYFNMNKEFVSYVVYIYILTIIGIWVKPGWLSSIVLAIYVFVFTGQICSKKNCPSLSSLVRWLFVVLYTALCVGIYHGAYWFYWNKPCWRGVFLLGPAVYYAVVKGFFYVMGCDPYSNYNYAVLKTNGLHRALL
jgi:hypothetical protein